MKKTALLIASALVLLFTSCQQKVEDLVTEAKKCAIQTGYYYGGSGGMNDSASFIYDAGGRLVKIANRDGHYLFTYNGSMIATRRFIDSISSEVLYLDSVWYNSSDRISKMTSYDYSGMFLDTFAVTYLLSYQNQWLAGLTRVEVYRDWTGNLVHDSFPARFDWDAGKNNIEKLVYYDNMGPYDSIQYQFDNHPNYFAVAHPHFFLFDPMFQLHVGLEAHFPYVYSRNNVTNTNIYGSWDNPIEYGHDSTNKLTSVDMGGFEYFKYRYRCP